MLSLAWVSMFGAWAGAARGAEPEPGVEVGGEGRTPEQELGWRIYHQGQGVGEIVAVVGEDTEVPASVMPCASCHGADGRGRPEGGLDPSNITWPALTRPYEAVRPSGRRHPPYDERAAKRAVTMGLDPAGNALHVAMPRYRLRHEEAEALVAYLELLGDERETGVTDEAVRVGIVLPPARQAAGLTAALREILEAAVRRANGRGGFYGRRIELVVFELPSAGSEEGAFWQADSRIEALKGFVEREEVFALVGGALPGLEEATEGLAATLGLPILGPVGAAPPGLRGGRPAQRHVFYLLSGPRQQLRALMEFLVRAPAGRKPRVSAPKARAAVVLHGGGPDEGLARVALEQVVARGSSVEAVAYDAAAPRFEALAAELGGKGVEAVVCLGGAEQAAALWSAAESLDWKPDYYLLGARAAAATSGVSEELAKRIFLAFPTLPGDVSPGGFASYRELASEAALPRNHLAQQVAALAAFELLAEGLERAGRELSRDGLVTALEGLYRFETSLTPPLSFDPNRRIGALGAWIVSPDPASGGLTAGQWVTPR